ncbi:MAG: hypothetical protein AABW86_03440 [Candidatus Micrarchaeota archaeon]
MTLAEMKLPMTRIKDILPWAMSNEPGADLRATNGSRFSIVFGVPRVSGGSKHKKQKIRISTRLTYASSF